MGAYVSTEQCQTHYGITLNCSFTYDNTTNEYTQISDYTPGSFPSNADIAGVGILGVFIAVTGFALTISSVSVFWQMFKFLGWKKVYPSQDKRRKGRVGVSDILEALVLSCSDQQVFTGAAYALTLRYWNGCTVSAYHYNIVANMLLLTCATHLMAVTIVRNYWQYPWLGLLRALCISGVFVFTGLLFVNQNAEKSLEFPTDVPHANETSSLMFMPAACFESGNSPAAKTIEQSTATAQKFGNTLMYSDPGNKIHGWNLYIITLLFFVVALIVEVIRLIRRGREKAGWRSRFANWLSPIFHPFQRANKLIAGLFLLYLFGGIGISAASTFEAGTYIFALRSWVYKSGWIQYENMMNPEQDATDFGQLVPIFMSALILFSFLQIISDKVTEHNEHKHENDPEKPHQGEHLPFIDPSKTTLIILNNTDTAYQGSQVATPGTYDIDSVLSTWNLNNSRKSPKDPAYQMSTVEIASPGLGLDNHSPLLHSRHNSSESISRSSQRSNNASANSGGSPSPHNMPSSTLPTPGSRRASSNLGTPPLSSSSPPAASPTLVGSPNPTASVRSFSTPGPLRPGYSPLNHQLGD